MFTEWYIVATFTKDAPYVFRLQERVDTYIQIHSFQLMTTCGHFFRNKIDTDGMICFIPNFVLAHGDDKIDTFPLTATSCVDDNVIWEHT